MTHEERHAEALRWACEMAERGYPVFPVVTAWDAEAGKSSKQPLGRSWIDDATVDVEEVVAAFAARPAANAYGVHLGAVDEVAIDLDVKGDGIDTWRALCADQGEAATFEVVTPSGGMHLWYRFPGDRPVGCRNGWLPGIDVKGVGGFVVGPGSWGATGPDSWSQYVPEVAAPETPADAPEWLLAMLPKPAGTGGTEWTKGWGTGELDARTERAVSAMMRLRAHSPVTLALPDGRMGVHVCRPGKARGTSASIGVIAPGVVRVFTSGWPGLPEGTYDAAELELAAELGRAPTDEELLTSLIDPDPREVEREPAEHEERKEVDPASGWAPVDLGPILAGAYDPPTPAILARTDERRLLYAGRINMIFAEPGLGKSWIALEAIAQEIRDGGHGALIDLEDEPTAAVSRLRVLGLTDDEIAGGFTYVRPDAKPTRDDLEALVAHLSDVGCTLAVIDSYGELLAAVGANPNHDEEVALVTVAILRPFTRAGMGLLLVDHVNKDPNGKKGYSTGSHRKRAMLTGAQYELRMRAPFAQGADGEGELVCWKDRHGHFQRGQVAAEVKVTSLDGGTRLTIRLHAATETPEARRQRIAENRAVRRVLDFFALSASLEDPWQSERAVTKGAEGREGDNRAALARLVSEGKVEARPRAGRGGGQEYRLRADFDLATLIALHDEADEETPL